MELAQDLRRVYKANSKAEAEKALDAVLEKWGKKYSSVKRTLLPLWNDLLNFYDFPQELWVSLYTTNPVERVIQELKRRLRPVVLLPNQEAAEKLVYLVCLKINEGFSKRRLRRWVSWERKKLRGPYLLDAFIRKCSIDEMIRAAYARYREHNHILIGLKEVAFQKVLFRKFDREARERGLHLPLRGVLPRVAKESRIARLSPWWNGAFCGSYTPGPVSAETRTGSWSSYSIFPQARSTMTARTRWKWPCPSRAPPPPTIPSPCPAPISWPPTP